MKIKRTPHLSDRWAKPEDPEWDKRFKKAMWYAGQPSLKLTRQERLDLARMIPSVDRDGSGSWKELSVSQLDDLLNMLEGWVYITHLLQDRETSDG